MKRTKINHIDYGFPNICNMNCSYCYHRQTKGSMIPLQNQEDKIIPILNMFELEEYVVVDFMGGEVMILQDILLKSIRKFKKYERDHNVKFIYRITSNGTNIDKLIEYAKDGIFQPDLINISYDGKYSDRSFKDINDFKPLLIYKNDISFHIAITKKSVSHLYETVIDLMTMGFRNIEYYYLYTDKDYETDEMIDKFSSELDRIVPLHISGKINMYNIKYAITKKAIYAKTGKVEKGLYCELHSLAILPDGTFSPCAAINRYMNGDNKYTYTENSSIEEVESSYKLLSDFYSDTHCPSDKCGNYQCCECILFTDHKRFNSEHEQCKMRTAERIVFDRYL